MELRNGIVLILFNLLFFSASAQTPLNFLLAKKAGYDPDAQTFITNAGITDNTEKTAINELVLDLKAASLWTQMIAIYPLVGGTSTTCKYNLKDPQDTDAAFRIVWSGGLTFDATGVTGDGANYGDTKMNPTTHMTTYDTHGSVFIKSPDSDLYEFDFGTASQFGDRQINMAGRYGTSNIIANSYEAPSQYVAAHSGGTGFFVVTRTSASSRAVYRNATLLNEYTTTVTETMPDNYMFILTYCLYTGLPASTYSTKKYQFFSFGSGLTSTEEGNLNTAVTDFNATLGR